MSGRSLIPANRWDRAGSKPAISWRLLASAMLASVLIAVLHGHHCSGDGCALCLVAHLSQLMLCVSCGIAVTLPARALLVVFVAWGLLPAAEETMCALVASKPYLGVETPVTQKVKLLI